MSTALILLSRSLSKFVVGTEGNVSHKNNENIYIKASGTRLSTMCEDDIITCDLNGNKICELNKKQPSMEIDFHSLIYKYNPNIKFIAHTHPINTLKILCSNDDIIKKFAMNRMFPDQVIFNGSYSCVVPYKMPGEKLKNEIKKYLDLFIDENNFFPDLILLKNHGIICCGKSYIECIIKTEICEKSAEIFNGLQNPHFFSDDEISEIFTDKKEIYRKNIL